ncbi:hypothetical protein D3C79_407520 [compost metagenome]
MVRRADLRHVAVTGMKGAGSHNHHGDIHQPGYRQRDHHLDIGKTQQLATFAIVTGRRTVLGQTRVQENGVRHYGGTDNADGNGQCLRIRQLWRYHAGARRQPVDRHDKHLGEIAQGNDRHQPANHQLNRAETFLFYH